ncbi:MAG: phosphoribosylanthranilate isomerase [Desulfovibrionaceae bacterium]
MKDSLYGAVQAAGICDLAEARMLVAAGFTHLGFPLGPGVQAQDVTPQQAAAIAQAVGKEVVCVCITYLTEAEAVLDLLERCSMRAVQLHGAIPVTEAAKLRNLAPDLLIIKSIVVGRTGQAEPEALVRAYAPHVDAFLTDTFDPTTGAEGATGKVHDWAVSRRLVSISSHPVILAGGLHLGNVVQAIQAVRPAGVDAHTGLEDATGRKDLEKAQRFTVLALQELPKSAEQGKQNPPFSRRCAGST